MPVRLGAGVVRGMSTKAQDPEHLEHTVAVIPLAPRTVSARIGVLYFTNLFNR
jgi:hypothetical protein